MNSNPLQPVIDWLVQAASWVQPLGMPIMILGVFTFAFAILFGRVVGSWRDKWLIIGAGLIGFGVVFSQAQNIASALMG